MSVYLILARGPRADEATPILASSDPRVVGAALKAIARLDHQEQLGDRSSVDGTKTLISGEDADEPRP